jgi:hypothetical protein
MVRALSPDEEFAASALYNDQFLGDIARAIISVPAAVTRIAASVFLNAAAGNLDDSNTDLSTLKLDGVSAASSNTASKLADSVVESMFDMQ